MSNRGRGRSNVRFPRQAFSPNIESNANENTTGIGSSRGSGSAHRGGGARPAAHISLKRVEDLLVKTPEEIIFSILNQSFGLNLYLEADRMGDELIYKFTSLIEKAFECNSMRTKLIELIDKIKISKFFTQILYQAINKRLLVEGTYNTRLIKSALNICSTFIHLNPLAKHNVEQYKDRFNLLIVYHIQDPNLMESFQELLKLDEKASEQNERYMFKTFKNIDSPDIDPPDDFTQMSIVPNLNDILTDQTPFLRKNVTNGAYQSVHHYLDVQFRLLREDFIQPLRQGVTNFRKIIQDSRSRMQNQKNGELSKEVLKKLKNIESLNVYFEVYMDSYSTLDEGIIHAMKLKDRSKSINWENSKKLMFGSLVCFSSDFFAKDCLIGIICQRDTKKLEKEGTIYVKFNYDFSGLSNISSLPEMNTSYVMLETSAYFESYKHVLEALVSFQRTDESEFPFKENLIDCQNVCIPSPKYLKQAYIDFRLVL